ncbi:alpha/beta hydrolase domain-containing protein [Derxia lacustris]|uniref:alpha/beta hydrolase domain-containing protein n=1 Tax=Derxia lacustris TaxID=764842 RepID=UPI00111C801E|nr:alpha/beta hydrolase domain-containing protein [Derxia lacustris]
MHPNLVRRVTGALAFAAMAFVASPPVEARITRIDLVTGPAFGDASFGTVGKFDRIVGRVYGELDPRLPANRAIQDLELAPRNARGQVEYAMDVYLLRPRDAARGNGALLFDMPNRGNKYAHFSFNVGTVPAVSTSDPGASLDGAGDGFLQARGYTVAWAGWQGDLLAAPNRLRFDAPLAQGAGGAVITGRVRSEFLVTARSATLNLSSGSFTGMTHASYPSVTLDTAGATLTRRRHETDAREPVDAADWRFADCLATAFPGTPDSGKICLRDGFDPDYLYELIYTARDPRVLGAGFAATRDLVSFLRHSLTDDYGNANPLANRIDTTLAYGLSQAGRFMRAYLHLGFNADESGRRVFDGMNPHIAPELIPLNVRFGQPGRAYGQHEDHDYPAAEGPFSWGREENARFGETDGLLERCKQTATCPKIVQTVSSIEYWQGRMSLNTASRNGLHDLALPDNVRLYHFAGTQHVPGGGQAINCRYPNNPNSYQEGQRALLVALHDWVAGRALPPPSRYPRVRAGSLVAPDAASVGWPAIPGVSFTGQINGLRRLHFGNRFDVDDESGVITVEPPRETGPAATLLVPRVDADGNEVDGVRSVSLLAPLATHTGWNLRKPGFGDGELCGLQGGYFPFATTAAERAANVDPRLSLVERYGDHAGYVHAVRLAAGQLQRQRLLLPEDAARLISQADASSVLR